MTAGASGIQRETRTQIYTRSAFHELNFDTKHGLNRPNCASWWLTDSRANGVGLEGVKSYLDFPSIKIFSPRSSVPRGCLSYSSILR